MSTQFHYAFKVKDIQSTKEFYQTILQCQLGRETAQWVDFDFFGHQLSAHVSEEISPLDYCGLVDDVKVPIPHFGCILELEQFERIQKRLEKHGVTFLVKPQVRYKGKTGEQKTMFVLDNSNNPLEFKCYKDSCEIFK